MDYLAKSGGTVILVEDEPSLRKFYARDLDHLGHDVIVFKDGAELVQFMATMPEDQTYTIITDYNMPRLRGDEAIKQLKESGKQIRALIMSANSDNLERCRHLAEKTVDKKELWDREKRLETLDGFIRAA